MSAVVTPGNLGSEFDQGVAEPNLITLRLGAGLTKNGAGEIEVTVALATTTRPLYEYRDIWAEESGGNDDNTSEWSFGNGATGDIGLPIDDDWEVVAMYFQADTGGSPAESMEVHLVDKQTTVGAGSPVIATVNITAAGSGADNNAFIFQDFATPVAVPDGAVLAFRTGNEVGTWSDSRVGARLRRQVGTYVDSVTLLVP